VAQRFFDRAASRKDSLVTTRGRADQYQVSVTRPPDFDAFWDQTLAELDAIPLDPELIPVPMRSTDEVEVFELHYTSLGGLRIAGWYCRPRAEHIAGPYPGLSIVPGYVSEPTLPKSWAKMGYAAVGVAPRGKLRSNSQFNPGYPGLLINRIVDRNTYSYRGFYCDALRAIDFLLTRDEVDSSRIGVHGSSQGGALTIVSAALRPDAVTCGAAGAPYLTGYMDSAELTHSYPYEEMNEYFRLYPERKEQARETLNYFDCLNLAPRVKAPMLVYAGLCDDVCPPETAFALKQALPGEVTLHTHERCGHDAGNYWEMREVEAFLAEHLRPATTEHRAQMTVG
jgi:cephalosporin-C deacetylase